VQPLYTVGHSSQSIAAFIGLLQSHDVEVIADVRSRPYSRRFPHFATKSLQASLAAVHIRYVFLGRELGARREEPECYIDGQASYERIAKLPAFAAGIERLLQGAQQYRVALLCAEQDPLTCHRTILVCRELQKHVSQPSAPMQSALSIRHILRTGEIEDQPQAEQRLVEEELGKQLGRSDQADLFARGSVAHGPDFPQLLQQAYERRADRIAYRAAPGTSGEGI
jgi:Protein of unknown function, DUF488